jgi:hypothetical protein
MVELGAGVRPTGRVGGEMQRKGTCCRVMQWQAVSRERKRNSTQEMFEWVGKRSVIKKN